MAQQTQNKQKTVSYDDQRIVGLSFSYAGIKRGHPTYDVYWGPVEGVAGIIGRIFTTSVIARAEDQAHWFVDPQSIPYNSMREAGRSLLSPHQRIEHDVLWKEQCEAWTERRFRG